MSRTLRVTEKQLEFIEALADEVLFGGAAGGGKSMGQLIDAAAFAVRYPQSRQLILRRTLPELERTLIRTARGIYPQKLYSYSESKHLGRFANGSTVEFGYCDAEADVYRYQSAEYDVIRFDELTHFTEFMYLYLSSRVRGANGYPKQVKSSTNPGGVGHDWVKRRFIDIGAAGAVHETATGSRLFIPSLVSDNPFLESADPKYKGRLMRLPENERRALLLGEWNISGGRFFPEWDAAVHVVRPFDIPQDWQKFFVMDYGLDMLAGYFIAVDSWRRAYVYAELYRSGLIISDAARLIASQNQNVSEYIAPPDLWNRRQDSGKSAAEIFANSGILLNKAGANRRAGWLALKELLRAYENERGEKTAGLVVFDSCVNAIRTMGAISVDPHDPVDAARAPHELTHAPDALRYFASYFSEADDRRAVGDEQLLKLLEFGV